MRIEIFGTPAGFFLDIDYCKGSGVVRCFFLTREKLIKSVKSAIILTYEEIHEPKDTIPTGVK